MKCLITATSARSYTNIVEKYGVLNSYNYSFKERYETGIGMCRVDHIYKRVDSYIEINTLDELLQLSRDVGCELIVDENVRDGGLTIEIYDGYRE